MKENLPFKKRFGLMLVGIGAVLSVAGLVTNELSTGFLIGSTILVVIGIVLWFLK